MCPKELQITIGVKLYGKKIPFMSYISYIVHFTSFQHVQADYTKRRCGMIANETTLHKTPNDRNFKQL